MTPPARRVGPALLASGALHGLLLGALLLLVITLPLGPLAERAPGLTRDLVKLTLGVLHALLARWPALLSAVLGGALLGGAVGRAPERWRSGLSLAGVAGLLLALPLASPVSAVVMAFLIGVALAPEEVARRARWVLVLPGAPLLWPGVALAAARPGWQRGALLLGVPWAVAMGGLFDLIQHPRTYAPRTDQPGSWPVAREDPRVTRVASAPAGVSCEFHDVDVLEDRVTVVAEGTGRLLLYDPDGTPRATQELPAQFGVEFGVILDSVTDPETGWTWVQTSPSEVSTLRATATGWAPVGKPIPIPAEDHAYFALLDERDQLALVHVNTNRGGRWPWLTRFDRRRQGKPTPVRLSTAAGEPMPMPRYAEWVPTLQRLVVAPDFGDALWLVEPETGAAEPWITVPTLNGRPSWSAEIERLLVPLPQARELWIVEPATGAVERKIPVPLGVRTAAVDRDRDRLVVASVLTGTLTVLELSTGRTVDAFGGLMPLARKVDLDRERGVAWITTWGAVYRVPYAAE